MQVDISPSLQKQIEKLSKRNINDNSIKNKIEESQFIVIGQDHVKPLQVLQNFGQKVCQLFMEP
jgi:mRNA-degrading endonuclease RelE of RelBE toxin-antitoxin system